MPCRKKQEDNMAFQMIGGLLKMGFGMGQFFQGQAGLSSLQRPEYETPREIQEMLALARMEYADPSMPGEMTERDRIAQQAATAFQQSSGAGNPFAATAAIQAGTQAANLNLTTQSAQYNRQDLEAYKRALETTSQFKDMEFQINEFAPYSEKAQEYRDMIGAGTKNMFGGFDQFGGMADAMLYSNMGSSGDSGSQAGPDYDALNAAYQQRNVSAQDASDVSAIQKALMGAKQSQQQTTTPSNQGIEKRASYDPSKVYGGMDFSRLTGMGFKQAYKGY